MWIMISCCEVNFPFGIVQYFQDFNNEVIKPSCDIKTRKLSCINDTLQPGSFNVFIDNFLLLFNRKIISTFQNVEALYLPIIRDDLVQGLQMILVNN